MLPVYSVVLTFVALLCSASTPRTGADGDCETNNQTTTRTTVAGQPRNSTVGTTGSSLTESIARDSAAKCRSLSGSEVLIGVTLGVVFGLAVLSCLVLVKGRIDACRDSICVDGSPDFTPVQTSKMPGTEDVIHVSLNLDPEGTHIEFPGDSAQAHGEFPGDSVQAHGEFHGDQVQAQSDPSEEALLVYASIKW